MSFFSKLVDIFSPQTVTNTLSNDSVLRKLVADYEEGKTKWVLASDMAELFDFIDIHNFACQGDDAHKIEVQIDSDIAKKLKKALGKGEHLDNGAGIDWNDVSKYIGPAGIDGLVISMGRKIFDASYVYNGTESFLLIVKPDGSREEFYFCMEEGGLNDLPLLTGNGRAAPTQAKELNYTPTIF